MLWTIIFMVAALVVFEPLNAIWIIIGSTCMLTFLFLVMRAVNFNAKPQDVDIDVNIHKERVKLIDDKEYKHTHSVACDVFNDKLSICRACAHGVPHTYKKEQCGDSCNIVVTLLGRP
jgi:hypothetical protein